MDKCIDSVDDQHTLSALHANLKYEEVQIDKHGLKKIAFIIHYSLYQFFSMSFRLENAPITFWEVIDVVLLLLK